MRVLVLGVGNLVLNDEGVGVRALEAFEAAYELPPGVETLDGGTAGMELLDPIANLDHLIILDAVHTGDPAGTIIRIRDDEVPAFFRTKISPHQLGVSDVLAASTLASEKPKHLTLIGIVPENMETGMDLSPMIAAKIETLVAMAVEELERIGLKPRKRPGPKAANG